ncbi:type II toxin-antitoxin system RelE/ParE family toxin [Nesterenkonia ebinurensis]|uniref:type II toxin-antitoxin system RelE/ParE family toxin n=1 Tax=Nesterenkonia ebinurensis TaxID=2608252 RepID=UPI00123CEDD3|nr:type II toxin-antitoxin system RelE/ParE family toxin [Nesterenkonia ebinurensis]
MSKPLQRSDAAKDDELEIIDWYIEHAGAQVAERLLENLAETYQLILQQPQLRSRYYAEVLPGLPVQTQGMKSFPHLVFYVELPEVIRVGRVLGATGVIAESFT